VFHQSHSWHCHSTVVYSNYYLPQKKLYKVRNDTFIPKKKKKNTQSNFCWLTQKLSETVIIATNKHEKNSDVPCIWRIRKYIIKKFWKLLFSRIIIYETVYSLYCIEIFTYYRNAVVKTMYVHARDHFLVFRRFV